MIRKFGIKGSTDELCKIIILNPITEQILIYKDISPGTYCLEVGTDSEVVIAIAVTNEKKIIVSNAYTTVPLMKNYTKKEI